MFILVKNLRLIKYAIKEWSKKQFGNIHDKLVKDAARIEYVEEKLLENATNYRLNTWITRLLKQREKMMLFNQKY